MGDIDGGDCLVLCCAAGCASVCEGCANANCDNDSTLFFCCALCALGLITLVAVLVAACAFVVPVRVGVDEAPLGRLALATNTSSNVTAGDGGEALSDDIAVTVEVRNANWALRAWRVGPMDGELRFRGRTFARVKLAGGEVPDRIELRRKVVYRAASAAERAPVAGLGSDGAAELARENAAGVFELELLVAGEFKYHLQPHRRSIRVTCPLKLSLSTATATAAFTRVKCA